MPGREEPGSTVPRCAGQEPGTAVLGTQKQQLWYPVSRNQEPWCLVPRNHERWSSVPYGTYRESAFGSEFNLV